MVAPASPSFARALLVFATCSALRVTPSVTRRAALSVVGLPLLQQAPALAADDFGSELVGTYSDPNHPGGTREIMMTNTRLGSFRLAQIKGVGGRGEPASFELPAMIAPCQGRQQGTCITIDFSPKGGPREFTGFYDAKDQSIYFPVDGNRWPKI
jgi:hypothetical protein